MALSTFVASWRTKAEIWELYARFNGEKMPTSSSCRRCDECDGIQRVIIFSSLQIFWNSMELWLSWPSIISRWYTPTERDFVCTLKCFSHSTPSLLVVQPFE